MDHLADRIPSNSAMRADLREAEEIIKAIRRAIVRRDLERVRDLAEYASGLLGNVATYSEEDMGTFGIQRVISASPRA